MRNFGLVRVLDDEGVKNVGGRIGAARGPVAFSQIFDSLKGYEQNRQKISKTVDISADPRGIEQTHEHISQVIRDLERDNYSTLLIGGGHDHAYPLIRAYSDLKKTVGCINIDAHFDLRKPNPLITSGSPFYLAIEAGRLNPEHLIEFGIQKQSNNNEVRAYADQKKIKTRWFDELRDGRAVIEFQRELNALASKVDCLIMSVDLDAFSESYAPGVSAPQAEGFTPSEGIQMVEMIAKQQKNISMGVFELNPLFDQNLKTARLAATLAWKWIGAKE